MSNHYRTLGVDPKADPATIRTAYLALIRRLHPDRGGGEADAKRAQAVTAAWEVLRDTGRREAYDESRHARFQPGASVSSIQGSRVRGGVAGRNLFLALAVGTIGLGWWALQQPRLSPPTAMAANGQRAVADESSGHEIRPVEDQRAAERHIAELEESSQLPGEDGPTKDNEEPKKRVGEPVRRLAEAAVPVLPVRAAPDIVRQVAANVAAPKSSASDVAEVDLAPLERHLQLLTDQSYRFATDAKRSRLTATGEPFMARLRLCDSDACKRDAYLRRNAEIGEIMRN